MAGSTTIRPRNRYLDSRKENHERFERGPYSSDGRGWSNRYRRNGFLSPLRSPLRRDEVDDSQTGEHHHGCRRSRARDKNEWKLPVTDLRERLNRGKRSHNAHEMMASNEQLHGVTVCDAREWISRGRVGRNCPRVTSRSSADAGKSVDDKPRGDKHRILDTEYPSLDTAHELRFEKPSVRRQPSHRSGVNSEAISDHSTVMPDAMSITSDQRSQRSSRSSISSTDWSDIMDEEERMQADETRLPKGPAGIKIFERFDKRTERPRQSQKAGVMSETKSDQRSLRSDTMSVTSDQRSRTSISSTDWSDIFEEQELQTDEMRLLNVQEGIKIMRKRLKNETSRLTEDQIDFDEASLVRKQKQLDFGKITSGYQHYLHITPKSERTRDHPRTPNKFKKVSRRSWDMQVRLWRKQLHLFDPPTSTMPSIDSSFENISEVEVASNAPSDGSWMNLEKEEDSHVFSTSSLCSASTPVISPKSSPSDHDTQAEELEVPDNTVDLMDLALGTSNVSVD